MTAGFFGNLGEEAAFSRDLIRRANCWLKPGYGDGLEMTLEYPDMVYSGVSFNTNAQRSGRPGGSWH